MNRLGRRGWRDRLGDDVVCAVCGETRDSTEVDRMLWCEGCQARFRARANRIGWGFGLGMAALVSLYIWLGIRPSDLLLGGWIATVVFAAWLGAKIGREAVYGYFRYREAREDPPGA